MRIHVAEDEPLILKAIVTKLLRENYSVIGCSNGRDTWDMIEENTPRLFITDIVCPFVQV